MELAVEVKEISDEAATFSASVKVDGKAVTTARTIRLVPMNQAGRS
jgi:hypothetical protein